MKELKNNKTTQTGTIRFKEGMQELNEYLTTLSNLVIDMIQKGKRALIEDNVSLFNELEQKLTEARKITYSLENSVQNSIALLRPFASDLRYILSTLKLSNEIYRSARDAVHIARSTTYITKENHKDIIDKIGALAAKASEMFKESVEAFESKKALDINKWKKLDDTIDKKHDELFQEIVNTIQEDPKWARAGVSLILTTRYIERIADHACNIVEESYYVVTSKRVKIE